MNRGGWLFFRLANDSQHHNHHDHHHWWQYCQWAKRGAMSQTTRGSNYEYWKSSFHSPSYWGKSVADSWDEEDGNGRTKSYCSCWQTENTGATPIFNPRLLVGRRVASLLIGNCVHDKWWGNWRGEWRRWLIDSIRIEIHILWKQRKKHWLFNQNHISGEASQPEHSGRVPVTGWVTEWAVAEQDSGFNHCGGPLDRLCFSTYGFSICLTLDHT